MINSPFCSIGAECPGNSAKVWTSTSHDPPSACKLSESFFVCFVLFLKTTGIINVPKTMLAKWLNPLLAFLVTLIFLFYLFIFAPVAA